LKGDSGGCHLPERPDGHFAEMSDTPLLFSPQGETGFGCFGGIFPFSRTNPLKTHKTSPPLKGDTGGCYIVPQELLLLRQLLF